MITTRGMIQGAGQHFAMALSMVEHKESLIDAQAELIKGIELAQQALSRVQQDEQADRMWDARDGRAR